MPAQPLTSIVIPSLHSPWVGETLQALSRDGHPGPTSEVIVVGQDRHGLVPRDGRVRFHETASALNPASARNQGAGLARGSVLLFTDADCSPVPGWAQALLARLASVPVVGGAVEFERRGNAWAVADNIASFHGLLAASQRHAGERLLGTLNLGVRRDAWLQVGGFDEALPTSEDHDWILRARAAGIATAFVPEARVRHAQVRTTREALEAHAAWYGRHFPAFRSRHPGALASGWAWQSPRRLRLLAPLKALAGTLEIFVGNPWLWPSLATLPKVWRFKRAWYRAVLEAWRHG